MAGGRIGKVRDGDQIQIEIDTRELIGSVDFLGDLAQLDARSSQTTATPSTPR